MQNLMTIKHYEELLEKNPADADALHMLGILLAQSHHHSEALDKIQLAIQIKSNNATYYNSLGNVFRRLNKLTEAQKAFQKAIKIQPQYAIAHNNLGNVFLNKKEFISAEKSYRKAIKLKPDYADAYTNLGILLAKIEDNLEAIFFLEKALALNPNLLTILGQLGNCYLRTKQYEKTRDIFLEYIQKQNQNSDAHHQLGIAYFHLKDFTNAKIQFEYALTLDNRHNEANQYLANTHLELRDHDKAIHHYFKQLDISPFFETYYNIGVLLMIKERTKDALLYFSQALNINPNDLACYLNAGSIYLKHNDLDKAIACYKAAHKLKPDDEEIKHILSAIQQQDNAPDSAPASYITNLFDQYAPYYDHHLITRLEYTTPEKIAQILQLDFPSKEFSTAVDLGCGTGLCGSLLKPICQKLIGIDLSENMLTAAREKNCYDQLVCGEITDSLKPLTQIDLVTAADVFTYIGSLEPIFSAVQNALSPTGAFIFSIEKSTMQDYVLQASIRYAHSKKYIKSLAAKHHFSIARFDNTILRKQKNEPVEGYLVMLTRND